MKLLKRSKTNKVIFGVIGGLGEYFDVDPVILRLLFVFITLFTGLWPGVAVYIIAAIVVPDGPKHHDGVNKGHEPEHKE